MKVLAILSLLVAAVSAQRTADGIRVLIRDDYHKNSIYAGQVKSSPFEMSTYQFLAREETATRYAGETVTADIIINYYVLRCIYAATNGKTNPRSTLSEAETPEWKVQTGWSTPATSTDYCTWHGITCESGLVIEINLANNTLYGSWPEETAFIGETLESIDLFSNFFHFCGTYEWFQSMKVLKFLFFGTTSWDSNGIPSVLKFLENLFELDMSNTFWRGYINPDAFTGSPDLYYLDMGQNFFGLRDLTDIPDTITNKSLIRLFLDNIKFLESSESFTLDFVETMPTLTQFWADFTKFTGGMPTNMGNAVALQSLSLTYCLLTGPVPASLSKTALQEMWLYGNKLSGNFPATLVANNWRRLYIEQNEFTGSIASGICDQVGTGEGQLTSLGADCTLCNVSGGGACCTCCEGNLDSETCGNLEAVTPAPTGAPTGGGFVVCFSGDSEVDVENYGPTKMSDLSVGDRVKVADNTFEPVYSFGHKNSEASAEFLQITTEGRNRKPLELSKDHMVVIEDGRNVPASMVKRGDKLVTSAGELVTVKTIRNVVRKGAYAPFTASGSIIVNDVVASNYVAFQGAEYIQVAGVSTPFSYQWVAHIFNSVHRIAYKMGFTGESYTEGGVSQWVAGPHVAGTWLLEQNFLIALALLIPAIALFGSMTLVEASLNSPVTAATVVVGAVSLIAARRSVSVKMTANKA
jgi:hypothetical protein